MGFEADFGVWEEGPEEHSSSYGAVLGGLTMWFDQGHYDLKYRQKIPISQLVPVSERMIAGCGHCAHACPEQAIAVRWGAGDSPASARRLLTGFVQRECPDCG